MIENKRFTVDGLTIAENSPKGIKYLLEYQGGVNALCNRINGLFDKSKRLEKENKELKQRIKRLENYKEASIKFTKEVEDFFERHEFDTVNFNLIDTVFDGFEFYSDKCDELKKENNELKKHIQELSDYIEELGGWEE